MLPTISFALAIGFFVFVIATPGYIALKAGKRAHLTTGQTRAVFRLLALFGIAGVLFNAMIMTPGQPLIPLPDVVIDLRYVIGLSLALMPIPLWMVVREVTWIRRNLR